MNREDVISLYDIYGELLTKKQRDYIEQYYFMDYSMGEIGEYNNVSRSAVSINIKKVISHLERYESILKIKSDSLKREKIIKEIIGNRDFSLLEKIK